MRSAPTIAAAERSGARLYIAQHRHRADVHFGDLAVRIQFEPHRRVAAVGIGRGQVCAAFDVLVRGFTKTGKVGVDVGAGRADTDPLYQLYVGVLTNRNPADSSVLDDGIGTGIAGRDID